MRTLAAALLAALFIAARPAVAQTQPFTPEQRQAIEGMVREYLLAHPEVVRDAIEALQQREHQAELDQSRQAVGTHQTELFADADAPVLGNPKGDVTIVEFFDYRCPYCKQMQPSLAELVREDGKIRLVMKEFPILGPDSVTASRAALAARAQGRYAPFHEALFQMRGGLDEAAIYRVAAEVGLDVERLKRDMKSADIDRILERNRNLAQALGVAGTPAMVVGREFVPGAVDKAGMKKLVETARRAG
jgi:protein-disulfide isomerase